MTPDRRKVLVAGESWVTHSVHQKGFDSFTTTSYEEGVQWLGPAVERAGYELWFVPNHLIARDFPRRSEDLDAVAAVLLSDVGSNTLLLAPESFERGQPAPNRLELLAGWVRDGGGLGMIGGYLSFQGIEAKANYRNTVLHEVLPVVMEDGDDRVEVPQGVSPRVTDAAHPVTRGLPAEWSTVLGYNRLRPADHGTVLAVCGKDPLVVVGGHGEGRTLAFATDCGPHWAPEDFVTAPVYSRFWRQALDWLGGA